MRTINWLGCIFAAWLGGCSFYPVPDDVSPYRTEDIVRFGRCEVKSALLRHLERRHIITDQTGPDKIRSRIEALKRTKRKLSDDELHLLRLTKVAIVYSYDFNITESNHAGAAAGFRLPWAANTLDVGGTGGLDLTRVGWRVFGTEDSWDDLVTNTKLCDKLPGPRPENIIYPMTGSLGVDPDPLIGSIGIGRVVETFIDIDEQRGAKDNFVDTLTFTTSASGGATATVQLDPVPNQFRPVSGSASVGASRVDIHKLTISLAFPQPEPPAAPDAISGVKRTEGDLNASPFERPPAWRARYNLCVQDARTREASFKQLRLTDPLVYCIAYADEFAPRYGRVGEQQTVATTTTTTTTTTTPKPRSAAPAAKGAQSDAAVEPTAPSETVTKTMTAPTTTTTTTPRVRPNLRPYFQ
ncbi:hypothetical protein [Bradyrhizobium sp. WSM3983]|uniref:hypothetical protein n=1 Tax=Bradyrhizobium sp. WSM3983 TaxID=1038867 RepID=UPI00042390B6|nr:hypothetical protein [Bradyrhizobium sp. WSM3983]